MGLTKIRTAAMPTGSVLQVKSQLFSGIASETGKTSTSYGTTGAELAITPSSTSSKIQIMITGAAQNGSSTGGCNARIYKDGSQLTSTNIVQYADSNDVSGFALDFLDSPATTSSVTYQLYYAAFSTGTAYINFPTITLMEIAG